VKKNYYHVPLKAHAHGENVSFSCFEGERYGMVWYGIVWYEFGVMTIISNRERGICLSARHKLCERPESMDVTPA
jgi:hypothetical protein